MLRPRDEDEEGAPSLRVEIPPAEEGRDISWWGLEDGDAVSVEKILG